MGRRINLTGRLHASQKLDQTKPDASGDTVDLSTEMVNLMSARNEYEANLKSIQTSEEMSRRTLDILA